MKTRSTLIIGSLMFAALLFTGCSSNDGSTAQAGRARVTTGVITSISAPSAAPARAAAGGGTIVVNGVAFKKKSTLGDANVATFQFDETTHAETDLKPGMIVSVKGSVDPATKTGEFESIDFKPELRGPVDAVVSSGTGTPSLQVMGHDVVIDANTKFDGLTGMADLESRMTGTNSGKHPEVEISGRMDSAGAFHATRISLESADFGSSGKVEIHGKIESLSADGFVIGTTTVVMTGSTVLSKITTTEITTGADVEVKGTLSGTTLTATKIEGDHGLDDDGFEAEDDISIQGIAAGALDGDGTFVLNSPMGPVTIKCTSATEYKGGIAPESLIVADAMLEVEGVLQADGSLLAQEVKSENEIELESEEHSGSGDSDGDS